MKPSGWVMLAACLLVAASTSKAESSKPEGCWRLQSGEVAGKEIPDQIIKQARAAIFGDQHTVNMVAEVILGSHKIDSSKQPPTIDATDTAGPFAGKTTLGIYEIKGDQFKVCFAEPGKERPKEFTTKSGTGHLLHVWNRDEPAQAELKKFQGTWGLVSATRDGKNVTEDEAKRTSIVIKDNTFRFPQESKVGTSATGSFTLDTTLMPKAMDSITGSGPDTGKISRGIYQFDGKRYKICFSPPGRDRPKGFVSDPGSDYLLQEWQLARP